MLHVVGAQEQGDGHAGLQLAPRAMLELAQHRVDAVAVARQPVDERPLAHEVRHEPGRGPVIEVVGRVPLLDPPLAHDAHGVGHGEGLVLVVGHEERGRALGLEDPAHLEREALAQVAVQVGERLVEQQHPGARGDGAGEGHALLLAAGKLVRVLGPGAGQPDRGQQLGRALPAPGAGEVAKPEGHVVEDVQVGEEGVVLEHDADAALLRRHGEAGPADHLAAQADLARVDGLEPCHAAKRRGLPAAARAQEAADLALGQLQVEPFHHGGHSRIGKAQFPYVEGVVHENHYSLAFAKCLICRKGQFGLVGIW